MKEQGKAQVAEKEQWKRKLLETAVSRAQDFVKSLIRIGEENPYEMILEKATPESTDWMEEYGLPVTDTDRQMMKFWFGLEKEKLQASGCNQWEIPLQMHSFMALSVRAGIEKTEKE